MNCAKEDDALRNEAQLDLDVEFGSCEKHPTYV